MATLTVGDVATRIKQRADIEKAGSSGFVSDAEMINTIQLGAAQLQNLIMNTYEYWLARYVTFTTVANQLTYKFTSIGMPDFYKLLAIGLTSASTSAQDSWYPLQHFGMQTMNLSGGGFAGFNSAFTDMQFRLLAADGGAPTLELRPVKSAQLVGVYYVPRPPQFSSLSDELPPWIYPGWEEYMVAFGAWMVGIKERSGAVSHKEVWMMVADQIKNFAPNRDSFQPQTVTQIVPRGDY